MASVAVILPCRGRAEQTIRNAARLKEQARGDAEWYAVGGPDEGSILDQLSSLGWNAVRAVQTVTYWQALAGATEQTTATLLVNVANDLLPGYGWLQRGIVAYTNRFGDEPGMMGFNGDSHGPEHSCHFIIHRSLLADFGGWPVWYHHNFGDTELCHRARELGRYAKAPWAILFHDHPYFGGTDDEVYATGRASETTDALRFARRKAGGWRNVDA